MLLRRDAVADLESAAGGADVCVSFQRGAGGAAAEGFAAFEGFAGGGGAGIQALLQLDDLQPAGGPECLA